jgi:branched-chain amino acid transport system substrate-binding protein
MNGATAVVDKVAATAPDYTAQCLLLKNGGVQTFEVGSAAAVVLRVVDACAQQGVTARLIQTDGTFTSSWLQDKNTNGALGVELVAPWFDTKLPAIQQFHQVMQQYAATTYNSAQFGPNTMYAWDSGLLFEAAAKAGNLGASPTPADVKRGLYALKSETLGGLVAPLTYTQGKPAMNTCYFTIGIQDGQFVAPDGATPTCIPLSAIAPLLKGLG